MLLDAVLHHDCTRPASQRETYDLWQGRRGVRGGQEDLGSPRSGLQTGRGCDDSQGHNYPQSWRAVNNLILAGMDFFTAETLRRREEFDSLYLSAAFHKRVLDIAALCRTVPEGSKGQKV